MLHKIKAKAGQMLKRRRYRYSLYLGLGLVVFFLASAIIAATLYGVLPSVALGLLDDVHTPSSNDKIMVLSPHCDDESLAAGGYDFEAIKNGAQVKIALVTNCNKHGWIDTRYKEFKNAAKDIGVPEANLEFWGFKEGMTSDKEFQPIEQMIEAEIKTYKPTVIITPMTQDAHYDHYLVGKATLEAMKNANYQGYKYGYLIHHRFFPQPKKYLTDAMLTPPIKYFTYGNGWSKFMLSADAVDAKNEAVLSYRSQLRIPLLNTLLKSMIRQDEIFIKLN